MSKSCIEFIAIPLSDRSNNDDKPRKEQPKRPQLTHVKAQGSGSRVLMIFLRNLSVHNSY